MPDAEGNDSIRSGECYNVVLWDGLQKNLVDAICQLLADGLIEIRSTSLLVYLVDGVRLRLPVAKSGKLNYAKPHWLPVVINRS